MRKDDISIEELREIHDDVQMLISMKIRKAAGPSFRMVRDEATGRYDMVPEGAADDGHDGLEWGDYLRSDAVEAVVGAEAYQRFWPENFEGEIETDEEMHLGALLQITAMAGGCTSAAELGSFARDWVDLRRMIARRQLKAAYLRLDVHIDGQAAAAFVTLEADQVVSVMLCQHKPDCGGVVGNPCAFWRGEDGSFNSAVAEDVTKDMLDLEILTEGVRISAVHLEAQRLQDACPAGVVALDAVRKFRSAIRA